MRAAPEDLFKARSDPTRRAIYEHLVSDGEQTVRALTDRAGVSPDPAVSWTVGLPAGVAPGDLRSARWQGRETLPQLGPGSRPVRVVSLGPFLSLQRRIPGCAPGKLKNVE